MFAVLRNKNAWLVLVLAGQSEGRDRGEDTAVATLFLLQRFYAEMCWHQRLRPYTFCHRDVLAPTLFSGAESF